MQNQFLIAIMVLLVLILFILFVINSLSLEVANKIKRDSETLFNSYNKVLESMTKAEKKEVNEQNKVEEIVKQPVYVLQSCQGYTNYKDPEIFSLYKAINTSFKINEEELIKRIDTNENSDFLVIRKMNDLLNENDRVYLISTLKPSSQIELMQEIIKENPEFSIFKDKLNDDFNIIEFKQFIEQRINETSEDLYVFTANKEDEEKSSEHIHYVYDSRIVVGVQCLKANRLYDYAIERKEVC